VDLFLVRHAPALSRAALEPGESDAERPLSERGRERFRREVRTLARWGVAFDRLLYSPWRRAFETAELLSPLVDGESVPSPPLARSPSDELLEELAGERVAVVGHAPWLSELLAWLVTGNREHGASFPLGKGGLAWLRGAPEPAGMELCLVATPRVLRRG
jgi:phosphohistidine phosphatase